MVASCKHVIVLILQHSYLHHVQVQGLYMTLCLSGHLLHISQNKYHISTNQRNHRELKIYKSKFVKCKIVKYSIIAKW